MMAGGIASLIEDFSVPAADGYGIEVLRPAKPVPVPEPEPTRVPNPIDRQAELLRAVEVQTRQEEREAARQQLEAALNAERERHQEEMAATREVWVQQEALQLSSQIVESFKNLESFLSDKVARILTPVIPSAIQQKALTEFNEILGTILSGETTSLMKVTGPDDLLSAIKSKFSVPGGVIEFVPSDDVEVTLIAGDTVVQTQFNSWSTRLQEALKAE